MLFSFSITRGYRKARFDVNISLNGDRNAPRREALTNVRTPALQGGIEGSYIELNEILTGKPRPLGRGGFTFCGL